jgi:hypothetical protein
MRSKESPPPFSSVTFRNNESKLPNVQQSGIQPVREFPMGSALKEGSMGSYINGKVMDLNPNKSYVK